MCKAQFQQLAERVEEDGTLVFRENCNYYLTVPETATSQIEAFPYLTRCGETSTYRLNFGNHLGLFDLAGVKIKVESTKITDDQFMTLLEEVSAYLANLPFSYQGGGGGFTKTQSIDTGVLYQVFIYLYSRLRQKQIQGAIYQIISNPYIKYEKEWFLHRAEEIRGSGYGTIKQIFCNPQYLVKLAAGSGLRETQLSHKLNGMFPEKIRTRKLCGYIDNPENHTYRDAIRGCRGAYVLYPGSETRIFPVGETGGIDGVGGIGCRMGENNKELEAIIEKIIVLIPTIERMVINR